MRAKTAAFVISAAAPAEFPVATLPEVAFAGRSNVGKSSLINELTGHGSLARTSRTPGRTRLVNWFVVEPGKGRPLHFVDLPGYGYAEVSPATRASWRPLIEAYLSRTDALAAVVLLIDIRRGAEQEEQDFLSWLAERKVATIVVLTKADKLPKNQRKPVAMAVRRQLGLTRDPILFSTLAADGKDGQDALWRAILAASAPA